MLVALFNILFLFKKKFKKKNCFSKNILCALTDQDGSVNVNSGFKGGARLKTSIQINTSLNDKVICSLLDFL